MVVDGLLCGRHKRGWMLPCLEFAYSSQTSEPSAKVTVHNGWSGSLWLSLEFGTGVQIEGTLDCEVSYPAKELDLPVGKVCVFSALDGNIDVRFE